ncbi:MAG: ATP-binding protein [Actinomycetota bacterium]
MAGYALSFRDLLIIIYLRVSERICPIADPLEGGSGVSAEVDGVGYVGRVRLVDDEGRRLYVDLEDGRTAVCTSTEPQEFAAGDVVFLDGANGAVTEASRDLWPGDDDTKDPGRVDEWVGVVRHVNAGIVLVAHESALKRYEREGAEYQVGNTVVGKGSVITSVVSSTPVTSFDLRDTDEINVRQFLVKPEAVTETFDDIAGNTQVVDRARELIQLPLQQPEVLDHLGAEPIKGVLFTGEPGTGKTMLARAIASEARANFYQISGPSITSKWYGESERVLRELFQTAAKTAPSVIFFDEIDSVAARRDELSHEASKKIVAQLLTEMDGFRTLKQIVVVAATNRPQDIDPALMRPGRFDWEVHFPLPTLDERLEILRVRGRRHPTGRGLPYDAVAEATDGWSGAFLAAVGNEAALLAAAERRRTIEADDYWGGYQRVQAERDLAADRAHDGKDAVDV